MMKNKLVTLILTIFSLSSVILAQESQIIEEIHKVIVSNEIFLQIDIDPDYSLKINTKDVKSECLINEVENGILTLRLLKGYGCNGKVRVNLTCPGIRELEIMGKAEVSTKEMIPGDSLFVKLQSGGKAYIDLDVNYLKVSGTGGSTFYAEGNADVQDINVSASASFSGHRLKGNHVKVLTSVSGMAKVCARDKLEIIAGSNTYISYACEPKEVIKDVKTGARIEKASE